MKPRAFSAAIAVAMMMSSGAACAAELKVGIASDPDALDPTTTSTLAARQVLTSLCDKLVDIDEKNEIVPRLATDWSWSEDMKTLRLNIRQGASFHDGEPIDADAVVYSLNRHLTMPGSTRASELSMIESVAVAGDYAVDINLPEPSVPLMAALAASAMIVSPAAAEAAGDQYADNPVCSGPYKFVERIPQDRVVVEKFVDHWDAEAYGPERIVFLPIADSTVRLSNLRSGDIHIMERVLPTDVATIEQAADLELASATGLGSFYIVINIAGGDGSKTDTPLAKDVRIREALELAIDREALNQVANSGLFTPGNQPVPPSNPYYIKEFPASARDAERARALVHEVTGGQPVTFTLLLPNIPAYRQYSEIIQSMAAEADIRIELEMQETTTALSSWASGDFQAFIIRWSGRVDPDGNIYAFKACDGARNGSKYCNPEVDRSLADSRRLGDFDARYEAFKDAAAHYLADRPYIYLFHPTELTGVRREVEGYAQYADGLFRFANLTLKQ